MKQAAGLAEKKYRLKNKLRGKVQDMKAKVEADLLDKYCYIGYANIIRRNRTIALKVGTTKSIGPSIIPAKQFVTLKKTPSSSI